MNIEFDYNRKFNYYQEFEQKYKLYCEMLYKLSFIYLYNSSECEDVLKQVFIKLFFSNTCFINLEAEKRWLVKTTIKFCKKRLKLKSNAGKYLIDKQNYLYNPKGSCDYLTKVLALPIKLKAILFLYFHEGYKEKDISKILHINIPVINARKKIGAGLLLIKEGSDVDCNEFRKILNYIPYNKSVEANLYNNSQRNFNERKRKEELWAKVLRKYSTIVIILVMLAVIGIVMTFVSSDLHPYSPKGVVKKFYFYYKNNNWTSAEKMIVSEDIMNYELFPIDELAVKKNYFIEKNGNLAVIKLSVKYLSGIISEYEFIMERGDGKWYIIKMEKSY